MSAAIARVLLVACGALLLFMVVWPIAFAGGAPRELLNAETVVLTGAALWLIWTGMSARSPKRVTRGRQIR